MSNTKDLLKSIQEARVNRKLNNRQFALFLGIDVGEWSKVSRGLRNPGKTTLMAFSSKLPEAQLAVMKYMAGEK